MTIFQLPHLLANEIHFQFSTGILCADENLIFTLFHLTVTIVPNREFTSKAPTNALFEIELSRANQK